MPRRFHVPLLVTLALAAIAAPAVAQTSDDLFDATTLQELRLAMSPRDLQTLRAEFTANTYYPADLQWRGVKVRNIALRSRGSGSRSGTKLGNPARFQPLRGGAAVSGDEVARARQPAAGPGDGA